ncbi:MAG TPA: hypothetical protein VJU13_03110 [Candidatus Nitrosocosmicus sp.]|nr:hypothetical protein [Candidatus Nitrosocosmicus sp.]
MDKFTKVRTLCLWQTIHLCDYVMGPVTSAMATTITTGMTTIANIL